MKRIKINLDDIAELSNLTLAFIKAAKGKRHRQQVIDFMKQGESNLNQLGLDIRHGNLPYGRFREFTIYDPKQRVIHAACFEDRIFHHAVMNLAGPTLEKAMLPTSFACRPEMGVHRAAESVQQSIRRKRRYQQRRLYWERQYTLGNISATQLQTAYASVHSILQGTDSAAWRRQNFKLHPPISV